MRLPVTITGVIAYIISSHASALDGIHATIYDRDTNSAACLNQIAGSWTLTIANLTNNGTTTSPYGDDPQGLLINTPAPDFTFMEELNARPGVVNPGPSQANAGTYTVDERGAFTGRTTLASTIASNVGVSESNAIFQLVREGDTLVETYEAGPGIVVRVVWTKFVPGSTSI